MADFTVEQLEQMEQSIDRERKGIIATADFVEPEELHRELIERIRKYHPNTDITMIEKAYHIAYTAHEGQCRKSGEPYIIHPLCVAIILADLEMDKETIVAGLLHDVVEDTVMTIEEISAELSDEDFADGSVDILTLLHKSGLVASKSEARRAVQQGGVAVDGEKVSDIATTFAKADFEGEGKVVRKGKKNFRKVIAK